MEWMLLPLKRYAEFSGRSRRKEYWMFVLLQLIVFGVLGTLLVLLSGPDAGAGGTVFIVLFGLVALALFIPNIAVQIRRFHDQDKSGWFILLGFIPYIGGIIMLVFMCIEGTHGPNEYGPDPKGEHDAETFA